MCVGPGPGQHSCPSSGSLSARGGGSRLGLAVSSPHSRLPDSPEAKSIVWAGLGLSPWSSFLPSRAVIHPKRPDRVAMGLWSHSEGSGA